MDIAGTYSACFHEDSEDLSTDVSEGRKKMLSIPCSLAVVVLSNTQQKCTQYFSECRIHTHTGRPPRLWMITLLHSRLEYRVVCRVCKNVRTPMTALMFLFSHRILHNCTIMPAACGSLWQLLWGHCGYHCNCDCGCCQGCCRSCNYDY